MVGKRFPWKLVVMIGMMEWWGKKIIDKGRFFMGSGFSFLFFRNGFCMNACSISFFLC